MIDRQISSDIPRPPSAPCWRGPHSTRSRPLQRPSPAKGQTAAGENIRQKRLMIKPDRRPPQLERRSPCSMKKLIAPNDAFFVRYHRREFRSISIPPPSRSRSRARVDKPLEKLSLADIKEDAGGQDHRSQPVLRATAAASSTARGRPGQPRQWRHGQCAGRRCHEQCSTRADCAGQRQAGDVQRGMDQPSSTRRRIFAKALDIDHARDGEVVACANGQDLPVSQRLPAAAGGARLFGTYWVKHLSRNPPCSTTCSTISE